MKKLVALSLAVAVTLGFSAPATTQERESSDQVTLGGFSGASISLSARQRTELRNFLKLVPFVQSVTCTGIYAPSAKQAERSRSQQRANAACSELKKTNPQIITASNTKASTARSYLGKVIVSASGNSVNNQNSALVDSETCKIKEDSRIHKPTDPVVDYTGEAQIMGRYSGNATAFPFRPTALPVKGVIDVALVHVEWDDLKGTKQDFEYYKKQIKMFEDFYWMASEQQLDMRIHQSAKWFRIPGSYKQHTLTFEEEAQRGEAPKKQVFYDAAVAASDPETDFTDIEIVFFAIPRAKSVFFHGGPHEFNFDNNGFLNTKERKIYDTTTPGDWFLKNDRFEPPWVNYVHEVGHMIGIPHQANEDFKDGRFIEKNNPINGYEIMANQGGATRTMSSWLRWLAGWLKDDQVLCATKESITDNYFELYPINRVKGEPESLVIRLSASKAVVVESRRFDPYFDRKTPNSKNGLIVYAVDATKASAQGNQALLSPRDITKYISEQSWRTGSELDAFFFQGDSVTVGDLKISAHRIGKTADIVRVTKIK